MWVKYETIFKVLTPVHVGYHKLGIIDRTRYYVPGKNFWGGLTAKITPYLGFDYERVGAFLKENIVFCYHYVYCNGRLYKPEFRDDGVYYYENIRRYQFEKRFIGSLSHTAIKGETFTAQEESLHEVEFILDRDKKEKQQVYLKGYFFVRDGAGKNQDLQLTAGEQDIKINDYSLKNFLTNEGLQVGGELRYGFGQLRLENMEKKESSTGQSKFPTIEFNNNSFLPSHLLVNKNNIQIKGDVEAVYGREWDSNEGAGNNKSFNGFLAWVPGSRLQQPLTVILEPSNFGVFSLPED